MTTWKRCGVTLGAMTALLAMSAPGAFAADEQAAPAPQATVAAAQVVLAPTAVKPVLAVVGGAKSLTEAEKSLVDGQLLGCRTVKTWTIYYVLGYEVYRSETMTEICD